MTTLFRPVHTGLDSKRSGAATGRTSGGYHQFGTLCDLTQTARFLRPTRAVSAFAGIYAV